MNVKKDLSDPEVCRQLVYDSCLKAGITYGEGCEAIYVALLGKKSGPNVGELMAFFFKK